MTITKPIRSMKGRAMRVSIADEVPVSTAGFIRVQIAGNYQAGRQHYHESVFGDACIIDIEDDVLRWLQVTVDLVGVDPRFARAFLGASTLMDAATGETLGSAFTQGRNDRQVAIEMWTKVVGECDGRWGYLQLPIVRGLRLAAPLTVGRNVINLSAAGVALPGVWLPGTPPDTADGADSGLVAMMLTTAVPPDTLAVMIESGDVLVTGSGEALAVPL